jgi:2-keto-4-pentenoate hydratase/2-oxohepta-3-ene-1,7-dioic acid hydratase in catechol pathway
MASLDFRLLTYKDNDGKARPGLLVGDGVVALEAASTLELLADWEAALPKLREIAADADAAGRIPLSQVSLMAPILYPSSIFCAASNYAAHHAEMSGANDAMPDTKTVPPVFFLKTPSQTVIGTGENIHLPRTSTAIDWEAELAVVIGKPAYSVSPDEAMDYVAGYTVMNDMSIRGKRGNDLTAAERKFRADRFRRKNFDGSSPMGPWITPKELVPDPYDIPIKLWVNGELMQDGRTGDMHYKIEQQISYLSEHLTLRPGDVISTGTPAGVGAGRNMYLKAGDAIVTTLGDLGTLETVFIDPK